MPGRKPPPKAAFAVRYFDVENWPSLEGGSALAVPLVRPMPLIPTVDRAPHTTLRPNALWRRGGFEKLDVIHERSRHAYAGPDTRQNWRFQEEIVNSVIERYEFTMYVPADRRGVYVRANRTVAEGALRRLRQELGVAYRRLFVDVKAFQEAYHSPVRRAWFNNLRILNVQSASLAGINVDRSDDFGRFLESGDLTSVGIAVEFDGHRHDVVVSQSNAIFFYMSDEPRAVQLACHVNSLLEPFSGVSGQDALGDSEVSTDEDGEGPDFTSGYS
ncbi:MAG: hypothetical protein HY690_19215 [Chloroflexi bacterium]|nr:hypothetical protein [Chloroflexota bacterium]